MPVVLDRSGAVFLHPMKTGGTWVREALTASGVPWHDDGDPHASLPVWGKGRHFTIVRNPLTWYRSYWAFCVLRGWGGNLILGHNCQSDVLDTFIIKCVHNHPGFLTDYFSKFTELGDGIDKCDGLAILRTATLVNDLVAVLREIGEEFNENALRATPAANQSGSLDGFRAARMSQEARALLVQSELPLFARYGFPLDV